MTDPTPGAGTAARTEESTSGRRTAAETPRPSGAPAAAAPGDTGAADAPEPAAAGSGGAVEGAEDPDAPRPLGIRVDATGDPAVDALLARLAATDHLGVAGHREVYEDVHGGLRDALAALDRAPGPTPGDAPHPPHHPRS
ncbi:hypothetical protein [Streptomyces bohaiensis]|uniref:hypothetical protein n=1 Tax=Streptomyces bohaiensis TaxID=1431344 RepID=UPI003B80456F